MGIAEVRTEFWWGNIRERENLEDVEGGAFLKGFSEILWEDVHWIDMAQDMGKRRADMKTVNANPGYTN
jgi:hypothetical protein